MRKGGGVRGGSVGFGSRCLGCCAFRAWCGSFHQLSTDASYLLTPGRLFVAVRVSAGLLLFGALRVLFSLIYLVLLATVRGGTSFLFPTAKKKQKQRKRLSTANSYVSRACGFELFGTSEKRLAQNSGQLKPSRFVNRYPHASPPVWVVVNWETCFVLLHA